MEMENLKFKDKENAKKFIAKMESVIKQEQDETFHVTSESKADWVIKKILAIEDEIDRIERQHERRVKQLEREKEFFKIRFGAELEGWIRANLNGRKKSIDLPHGRAGFRKSQETIEIIDQDAAVDWAKENCPSAL